MYTKRPVYAVPPNPFEKNHFLSDMTTTINKLLFEWRITICKAPLKCILNILQLAVSSFSQM